MTAALTINGAGHSLQAEVTADRIEIIVRR